MRPYVWLETLGQDVRYGVRMLVKSKAFTAVAVLTLALGIGANTAIFSVVNAVLLRPLPFPHSERLVRLWPADNRAGLAAFPITSFPNFIDWQTRNRSFEQMEAYAPRSFNITGGDQPQHIEGLRASPGVLHLLGVSPILGRAFTAEEVQPGRDHVVLLCEGLWQSRFAKDPGILGRTVKLNDESHTVIGILPATFQFPPESPAAIVLPQPPDANRGHGFLNVAARLKPGISVAQAQAEMDAIARQLEVEYPKFNKDTAVHVLSLRDSFARGYRPALLVFLSAVGFVLLIACANVANLFLGRTAGRRTELVVRVALGAGRFRLTRQLLTEGAILGLCGGAAGLLLAYAGMKGLVSLVQATFPSKAFDSVSMDLRVLGFALAASLAVGLLAGLAPALGAVRVELNDTLKQAARGLTGNRCRNRIRGALVVAEIALALILLTGAGLMLKSFALLERVSPGLHPENVLTTNLALGSSKYATTAARAPFVDEVLNRIQRLPGVQSAAVVTDLPLTEDNDVLEISIAGRPDAKPKPTVNFNIVGPGYLRTLGIPLVEGRDFSAGDTEAAPKVILINQAMARRFWAQSDPVGARISTDGKEWFTIVGVTGDVRQGGLREEPKPEVYLSYRQDPYQWPYLSLLVHTSFDPIKLTPSIQGVLWSVDKNLAVSGIATMEQLRAGSIAQPRLTALLLSVFAALAVILASVGMYGVIAYSVAQRTHEMGLRMALGARATDVLMLVVGQGMRMAVTGMALGLAGAFALTRVLARFLWGVRPTDPATFAAVSLLLAGVALTAAYLPARRAIHVDPTVALRYE